MDSYENKLLDAIELMAETKIQEANFNKTVQATIIKMTNAATAEYLVKYQDSRFPAYSVNKSKQYKDGQNVYVLIPGNDTTQVKMILGAVEKEIELATAIEEKYKYEIVGSNCVNSLNNTFELCSYTPDGDIKILYDRENLINLIHLNTRDVQEYIKQNKILCCGADFRTQLPGEQQLKGNYGIVFELAFEDGLMINYIVDINQMINNPYKLTQYTTQKKYFEIADNFLYINKVYVFETGFPNEDLDKENDIFIKNILLEGALGLTNEEVMQKRMVLFTPNGNYFSQLDPAVEKIIQANIKEKGNIIDNTGIKYYWFKENSGIDLTNPKFNLYGGAGWEYLTEGVDSYIVKKEDLITEEQIYKCVTEIEGVIYSQVISIKNYDTEIQLSISSSNGTVFYYDMGEITLTCNVDGGDSSNEYTYAWTYSDNNEGVVFLNGTTNIQNVLIKDISLSRKYTCSAYLDGHCIGTTSIMLYNQTTVQNIQFQLKVLNSEVFYQYDEDGNKPNVEIKPIKCMLYDTDGNEIDEEIFSKCEIIWTCPHNNTMLKDMVADMNNLTYTIEDRYDITKNNNKIGVQVKMDTQFIYQEFSINFIKAGEEGTNGTQYISKIICNSARDLQYPVFVESNGNPFWNFIPGATGRWFKVQLWKDNKKIFEDYEEGNSSEGKLVKIKWSILKNKYSNTVYDYSQLTVDDNGVFTTQGYIPPLSQGYHSPCSVVQCEIEYEGIKMYCNKPLIEGSSWPGNKAFLVEGSGFTMVQYDSQGRNPRYQNEIFELQILNQNGRDITQMGLTFNWSTYGQVWLSEEMEGGSISSSWIDTPIVEIVEDNTLPAWKKRIRPIAEWSGECVNAGVVVDIYQEESYIATLRIPIYGYLNRMVNQDLGAWNGNSIQLKTLTGGYIYTPQIGAGKKESDQSFTGMIMGKAKEEGIEKTGLLGYSHGEQSMFLDAESGGAIFGKGSQGGQVIIDPKANKSMLYSHNYWRDYNKKGFPSNYNNANKNGQGMIIDLTTPEIVFGNGKCKISSNGIEYEGGLTAAGILTRRDYPIAAINPKGEIIGASKGGGSSEEEPARIGYWVIADNFYTPEANMEQLPRTFIFKRYGAHTSFYLPNNFQITKAILECEYMCPKEIYWTEYTLGGLMRGSISPYGYSDPHTEGLNMQAAFYFATESAYSNPSYLNYTPGGEYESDNYSTTTSLDAVGVFLGDRYEEEAMFNGYFRYLDPVAWDEMGIYALPNYEVAWLATNNNLSLINQFSTTDASETVIKTKSVDLTSSISALQTDNKYFLYLAPIGDFASETVTYSSAGTYPNGNIHFWNANKNLKQVVFDKWRRQLQVKATLKIEGYINTNAFQ